MLSRFVRPIWKPKDHVVSFWINDRGNPLGGYLAFVFPPHSLSSEMKYVRDAVLKVVKGFFPGKHLTPASFRRIMASFVFKLGVCEDGKSRADFLSDMATLLNTSPEVSDRDLLSVHCDCCCRFWGNTISGSPMLRI